MYQFTSAFVTSFNVSAKSRTQWQLHFELKNVLFHCCFVKYTIVRQSQGQGKSTLWALLLIQQTEWKYAIIRKTVNSFLHSVWSLASIPWLQASKKQLTLSIFSSFHGLPWNSPCPGHTDIMHTYFRMAILQTLLCKLDCTYKDAHRPCTNYLTIPQQRLQSLPASVTSITRILILNDHISHHFSLHCASQLLCGVSVPRGWIFVVIIVRVYHASHIAFLTRSLGCTVWKEADAGITAMQLWSNMHGDLFGRHFKTMAVECEIKKDSDEKDTHTHTHTLLIYITGTHTHTNAPHTHRYTTHVHTHHRYTCTHTYTCVQTHKCTTTHKNIQIHTCIHMHTHAQMQTRKCTPSHKTWTYTQTCIHASPWLGPIPSSSKGGAGAGGAGVGIACDGRGREQEGHDELPDDHQGSEQDGQQAPSTSPWTVPQWAAGPGPGKETKGEKNLWLHTESLLSMCTDIAIWSKHMKGPQECSIISLEDTLWKGKSGPSSIWPTLALTISYAMSGQNHGEWVDFPRPAKSWRWGRPSQACKIMEMG